MLIMLKMDVRAATDTGGLILGGGSVVVDSLFNVAPIVCWGFVFCPSFVMHYLLSFLVLQSSSRERESWFLYFNCLPDAL